jgi:hypothetical protein
MSPCILVIGLRGHSLGAIPQPRLLSPLRSSLHVFQEKHIHVSVLLSQHGTALTGRGKLCLLALEFRCFSGEAAIAHCYGARRGMGNYYQLHMRDTTAPSKSCRSTDTNVLLATCNHMGRHGLYSRHYSGVFIAPRTHETQKPSVGQGLYPILLLALSALPTSAYTSLGVSQESYP